MTTNKTFLQVSFHDNDFAFPMESALKRLYGYIHDNNAHCIHEVANEHFSDRSIPDMFIELHKAKLLSPMFHELWVLEYLCGNVEHITRGLYQTKINWATHVLPIDEKKRIEKYLDAKVSLHIDGTFREKWENGEHGFLNLVTGEAGTF